MSLKGYHKLITKAWSRSQDKHRGFPRTSSNIYISRKEFVLNASNLRKPYPLISRVINGLKHFQFQSIWTRTTASWIGIKVKQSRYRPGVAQMVPGI
jgi:hypothetical protein